MKYLLLLISSFCLYSATHCRHIQDSKVLTQENGRFDISEALPYRSKNREKIKDGEENFSASHVDYYPAIKLDSSEFSLFDDPETTVSSTSSSSTSPSSSPSSTTPSTSSSSTSPSSSSSSTASSTSSSSTSPSSSPSSTASSTSSSSTAPSSSPSSTASSTSSSSTAPSSSSSSTTPPSTTTEKDAAASRSISAVALGFLVIVHVFYKHI